MTADEAHAIAAAVADPEIPVLTIEDLGILRGVEVAGDRVVVMITPTYSGCPALEAIRADIACALRERGAKQVEVRTTLSPAWTTEWMSEAGRRKLAEYGIAPPGLLQLGVCCPRCGSLETRERSRFGATACQAQYVCESCLEPFDHLKPH